MSTVSDAMDLHRLLDDLAYSHTRMEGVVGVLEDEVEAAPHLSQLPFR
jgi:hypothetical protein